MIAGTDMRAWREVWCGAVMSFPSWGAMAKLFILVLASPELNFFLPFPNRCCCICLGYMCDCLSFLGVEGSGMDRK
jgi:hypothetical protein